MFNYKKNGLIKTDNHGELKKLVADDSIISKDVYHIRQHSGIETRVALVFRVFRFCHNLLT